MACCGSVEAWNAKKAAPYSDMHWASPLQSLLAGVEVADDGAVPASEPPAERLVAHAFPGSDTGQVARQAELS